MSATTYTAHYTRENGAWVVTFDDLELSTWERTLDKAKRAAREALAVTLDLDSADDLAGAGVTVNDVAEVGKLNDVDVLVVLKQRQQADEMVAEVTQTLRRWVHKLTDDGLSTRDVATALGISHQRVAQILREPQLTSSR